MFFDHARLKTGTQDWPGLFIGRRCPHISCSNYHGPLCGPARALRLWACRWSMTSQDMTFGRTRGIFRRCYGQFLNKHDLCEPKVFLDGRYIRHIIWGMSGWCFEFLRQFHKHFSRIVTRNFKLGFTVRLTILWLIHCINFAQYRSEIYVLGTFKKWLNYTKTQCYIYRKG